MSFLFCMCLQEFRGTFVFSFPPRLTAAVQCGYRWMQTTATITHMQRMVRNPLQPGVTIICICCQYSTLKEAEWQILKFNLMSFKETSVTRSIVWTETVPFLQRAWPTRQPEPPVWSVSPASWTACPRWSPGRQLWETQPPSPPAAPTPSPARRRALDPGPSTTSCEGRFGVDVLTLIPNHQLHLQQEMRTGLLQTWRQFSYIWGPVASSFYIVHEIVNNVNGHLFYTCYYTQWDIFNYDS